MKWWSEQVEWWDAQTFTAKWVYSFVALLVAVMLVGVVVRPQEPQRVSRPQSQTIERALTDAEVEAKWNEQVEAAKRGVDTATREAAEAWDAAKLKMKRMWIEGQK